MQALILSSLSTDDSLSSQIRMQLQKSLDGHGYSYEWINLVEKEIEYCTGCGYCGNIKPGVCCKDDDMIDIFHQMANSELQIFVSPISFGGYNSELKKALDRYSALGLTTYKLHHGELHHPARYPNPVSFMSIGILGKNNLQQESDTFKLVSSRIALASFSEKYSCVLLNKEEESQIPDRIEKGFADMGVIS